MAIKRKNYAKLPELYEMPNLLDIQVRSYEEFLQSGLPKSKRENKGLEEVFHEFFPIESPDGSYKLEYVSYSLGKPKYDDFESLKLGMTFAVPLKLKIRLKGKKDIKEQEVYLGELPLMTTTGTFIINGDERVIVSQLHRSPGVSFEEETHPNGKKLFSARVIPYRGSWIEFEFDVNDCLHAVIDRRKKVVATVLLRAMGYSTDTDILDAFCGIETKNLKEKQDIKDLIGHTIAADVTDEKTGDVINTKYKKLDKDLAEDLWDKHHVRSIQLLRQVSPEIEHTLLKDHVKSRDEALIDIYRKLRPGDPATVESAQNLINRLFFDPKRYDLGRVGRHMVNRKVGLELPLDQRTVTPEDMVAIIKCLINLKNGEGEIDDIDHLGNRRIRTVGELLQNQFRIGLARLERSIRERLSIYDLENIMPHNLINSKLVSSVIRDFFGRSQLSQFMDQTNPLAEMTHKRRLSALGPGGLSRERAGFEVRDVHHSHYGRICPIETPEGPNIGLIASLCTYAQINEFGFIETPYRKAEKGRTTDKIDYLSADTEDKYIIAQANARLESNGRFYEADVLCRQKGDFPLVPREKVDYMDVSPRQLVSIAASLIPFLEHDDANRALMGSNMQRQAVPLMTTEAPLVATGMEYRAAKDSGAVVVAAEEGVVKSVQADEVTIGDKTYRLRKFMRSNADTCVNQTPIVKLGQKVKKGEVIADGPGTDQGELALGKNVLVAFMPWRGYNFEDAIIISEKLVKEDLYTSLHIEEFESEARDTRLGNEEVTRDIPNVSEDALKNLDEHGIVRIGAEVEPGDILVGKVTPKSETELSPEEKLLRAIFGEKAGDVRDTSLTVPPGVEGTVVEVKVFSRKGGKSKTKEEMQKEINETDKIKKGYESQIRNLEKQKAQKLSKILVGQKLSVSLVDDETGEVLIAKDKTIRQSDLKKLERCDLDNVRLSENKEAEEDIRRISKILDDQINELEYEEEREIDKIKRGDELPAGVLKKVVVLVATKRKIQVGDKMAGRHGNKGVVARIVPEEDMPFMPNGTAVEIILNPLGVPSRMNVGQILETHLGWAAKALGFHVESPVFDGAKEVEIKKELKAAGLPEDGRVVLYDGLSGRPFDQKITVGYIYMMKLIHLVDEKIHARSIGPYSLVTQQPLGGKAQFGGQRFGEMEVWALEAYGAAFTLQELLTVKSDDVVGRTRIYEAIVKGENALQPGTPESFNVLLKELQSLCLDVRTEKKK
ncbi:MAG: DNA-directed RNA polymerase subunit beta [Candidatus Omnitrophica bacterium]|nr:DNA-directed RNA polymerase subunit beta [Candidatus Omnitrophota bacterium]MDD5737591.1 DNA-directed RNA polymerase subunit beta [Candidatus Omnitrophota bacterium]